MPENTRSQDFRFVYANTFGLSFGPNEAQVKFGIQQNPGTDDTLMEEQVGVIFSHAAIKMFVLMLSKVIANFEEAAGKEIPLDSEKVKRLEEYLVSLKGADQEKTKSMD